jgi:DNA-binding transcriptional MerR regulator
MDADGIELSIEELAERAGVPVRTIRYYIAEGLLPGPGTRGKAAVYDERHWLRLRLIRRLADQRVPLATIKARLAGLSLAEIRALLDEAERQSATLAQAPSPRDYVAALLRNATAAAPAPARPAPLPPAAPAPAPPAGESWQRFPLAPGVELHVRRDVLDRQRPAIERLVEAARRLVAAIR